MIRVCSYLLLLLSFGCTASGDKVRPDPGRFYFPSAQALSLDGVGQRVLFVVSANADLRFDSGVVAAVDLGEVDRTIDDWTMATPVMRDGCNIDPISRRAIECDERAFIAGQGALAGDAARIGNFGTDVGVQALDNGSQRLFLAVRGDPSLTWVDYDPTSRSLSCSAETGFDRCDEPHRLSRLLDDKKLPFTDEPFSVHVDGENGYVLMSHLSAGVVTLASAPRDGAPPVLSDAVSNLFPTPSFSGQVGALGIAGRTPGQPGNLIYVTSRTHPTVPTLVVSDLGGLLRLSQGPVFTLARLRGSSNARDIVFREDGNRAFILNRDPPALHVIDTSLDESGTPKNDLVRAISLCTQPARLAVGTVGGRERVYVSCFDVGEVWVIDPDAGERIAFTLVGRGPNAVTLVDFEGTPRLIVGNVLEDTLSILDLTPGSDFENGVIMKLGISRQSEELD